MNVADILKAAGVHKLHARSIRMRRPVDKKSIYKWAQNGIPEKHWALVMAVLPYVTVEQLFAANQKLREINNRPRRPKEGSKSAAA
jgi:hypothetical protein